MVLVIGGGLAGSLAALALRQRGLPVTLLSEPGAGASATAFSYGGVPWWAAPAMAQAPQLWQGLERRHGPLGWQPCRLRLYDQPASAPAFAGPSGGMDPSGSPLCHGSFGTSGSTNSPPTEATAGFSPSTAGPQPAAGDPVTSAPGADPQAGAAARSGLQALLAASGLEAREWVGADGSLLGLDLPYGRIDGRAFAAAMPLALEQAGVERLWGRALALDSAAGSAWQVRLAGGSLLESEAVLVATGAASALLWPPLAPGLATSWAGVLALAKDAIAARDLPPGATDAIVMPLLGQRQALERQTPLLEQAAAVVDGGLAPWGSGWLLGQISLVNPCGLVDPEPDPAWMEARLRSGLARVWPALASLPATYHQVPVSFTASGQPLVGPVPDAPGLWVCAGVSAPFAALPPLVETLADQLAAQLA